MILLKIFKKKKKAQLNFRETQNTLFHSDFEVESFINSLKLLLLFCQGACIDVKLTSKKIWILKDSGLIFHNLSDNDVTE